MGIGWQVKRTFKLHVASSFNFRFSGAAFRRPPVWALLLANLFPIIGVALFGWDTFLVLALFWVENVVIGFYTILRLIGVASDDAGPLAKIGAVFAFAFQYGLFTAVHGFFVFLVFGTLMQPWPPKGFLSPADLVANSQLVWGAVALVVSHGVSFVYNYALGGGFRRTSLKQVTQEPFDRMVVLHLTIILGGILIMKMGSPVAGLIVLIALKMVMDLRAHLRQHSDYRTETTAPA